MVLCSLLITKWSVVHELLLFPVIEVKFSMLKTDPSKVATMILTDACNAFLIQEFLKDAINSMAEKSLRCVAVAYKTLEADMVPTDQEQLSQWTLPEDGLVLLAIVGIKVAYSIAIFRLIETIAFLRTIRFSETIVLVAVHKIEVASAIVSLHIRFFLVYRILVVQASEKQWSYAHMLVLRY